MGKFRRDGTWRALGVLLLWGMVLSGGAVAAETAERGGEMVLGTALRAAAPVLLVDAGDYPEADEFYHQVMDAYFGPAGWDLYDFASQGWPDPPELFLSFLDQYQGVVWHGAGYGGGTLEMLDSVLADYLGVYPSGAAGGRLLLVHPELGPTGLPALDPALLQALGVESLAAPATTLELPAEQEVLCYAEDLPALTTSDTCRRGTGLVPSEGSEPLYRLEYCLRCYSPRPPFDPYVAVRTPDRVTAPLARAVVFTVPLEDMQGAQAMLHTLMRYHLGFTSAADAASGAGKARLAVSNDGSLGNFFAGPDEPSLVYPFPGYVEHLYQGGLWVGARAADGSLHVSSSSDHFSGASEGYERREFRPVDGTDLVILSSDPSSEFYDPVAVAPWQLECSFTDYVVLEEPDHLPLGLQVNLRAMSWDDYPLDDGVALEYSIINISGTELQDLHVGLHTDATVGNLTVNSPYPDGPYGVSTWNYYDDVVGGWRPGDWDDDPDIWMMWKHDEDGDDGWATSWVGSRLLGSSPAPQPQGGIPPVSYNATLFRHTPAADDTYWDDLEGAWLPGRYQHMSNGDFDVGVTPETDFTVATDWITLLSTGPFPSLADGDTLRVSFAILCGEDGWNLRRNSRRFAELYAAGWEPNLAGAELPAAVGDRLERAVPNPFNPTTTIGFSLAQAGPTRLEVYGMDGRLVQVLLEEWREAGAHQVRWNGRDRGGAAAASGLYLYRLTAPGGRRLTGQMVLVR